MFDRNLPMYTLVLLVLSLSAVAADSGDAIHQAVADTSRGEQARLRDSARRPAEVMKFSGLSSGDVVLEIAPGGGYYTALLSRVVGSGGRIYAVDPERIFEHFPDARKGFPAFMESDPRDNVNYSAQFLDEIDIPEPVDQVWMVLYYHDTIWTGEDRLKMNRAFYDALKPGGVYLLIDHHALAGAEDAVTRELHRMDASIARADIEAAGFVLDAESDILAHPDDPRTDSVFAPERRGKTDRFVWRFRKPE